MTLSAAQTLRDAIAAWQRDAGRERVARWRGDPDAESLLSVIKRHAWLWSPGAQEALAEAVGDRQIDETSREAIEAWMAAALRERAWLEMTAGHMEGAVVLRGRQLSMQQAWRDVIDTEDRGQRAAVAAAIATHTANRSGRCLEARAFATERAQRIAVEPRGEADEAACVDRAERFLKDTADAMREHVQYLTRGRSGGEALAWHDVLFALRAHALDGLMPQVTRMRRVAEPLRALGFDRELDAHVRVEPMRTGALARTRLCVIDVPGDLRIGLPAADWGPISELSTRATLGRALSLSLVSSALGVELRRSRYDSVPRVFSMLCAQWMTDRAFVARAYGCPTREVERVARLSAIALLMSARRSATVVCLDAHGLSDRDRAVEMAHAAWSCEVPLALFLGWLPSAAQVREQWLGQAVGLAAGHALRDRFDEDWHRNPRVAEPLRGAAARGGELSAEAWAAELGADIHAASDVLLQRL